MKLFQITLNEIKLNNSTQHSGVLVNVLTVLSVQSVYKHKNVILMKVFKSVQDIIQRSIDHKIG
jgi:hypothetical protein